MKQKTVYLIMILVGSVFLALTLPSIFRSLKVQLQGISAESTVLSIEQLGRKTELKKVTVSFNTLEGKEVTTSASKRSYVSQGDKVKVYYDPTNPEKIDFGDTISYQMRGAVIGLLFLIFGVYFFMRNSFLDSAYKKLISSGTKIAAEFVSVERNEKYRMGNKNPWVIKCKWNDDRNNQEYYFKSKNLIIDPSPYLDGRSHVDVFIDSANPTKYLMDTSFMPRGNITMG